MEKHLWKKVPPTVALFKSIISDFDQALANNRPDAQLQELLICHGQCLLRTAVTHAQQTGDYDDRPLYWSRLCMMHSLRTWLARVRRTLPPVKDYREWLYSFELASRGMLEASNPGNNKLIIVSGFDPFGLVDPYDRSNPSGASVLALHQKTLGDGEKSAKVMGAIFPVRYADFDHGIVERFFGPSLLSPHPPDMVITISLNKDGFKVERYAGRRRSSATFADNAGCLGGGSHSQPLEPPGLSPGPEFIETSLPAATLRSVLGRVAPLANELRFMETVAGQEPEWKYTTPTEGAKAVCGSGGGFLSNEIFYRTSLLRLHSNHRHLPMGHLHIPALDNDNDAAQRSQVVNTVINVITAALVELA